MISTPNSPAFFGASFVASFAAASLMENSSLPPTRYTDLVCAAVGRMCAVWRHKFRLSSCDENVTRCWKVSLACARGRGSIWSNPNRKEICHEALDESYVGRVVDVHELRGRGAGGRRAIHRRLGCANAVRAHPIGWR